MDVTSFEVEQPGQVASQDPQGLSFDVGDLPGYAEQAWTWYQRMNPPPGYRVDPNTGTFYRTDSTLMLIVVILAVGYAFHLARS